MLIACWAAPGMVPASLLMRLRMPGYVTCQGGLWRCVTAIEDRRF